MQLTPDYATPTMFRGMSEGWFTGKKLPQYFNESKNDPVNARAIINNDVSKMGQKIAGYHEDFLAALEASARRPAARVGNPDDHRHRAEGTIVKIEEV